MFFSSTSPLEIVEFSQLSPSIQCPCSQWIHYTRNAWQFLIFYKVVNTLFWYAFLSPQLSTGFWRKNTYRWLSSEFKFTLFLKWKLLIWVQYAAGKKRDSHLCWDHSLLTWNNGICSCKTLIMHYITFSLKFTFLQGTCFVNGCYQFTTGAGLYNKVSQLWHFWHLGQDNFLLGGGCCPCTQQFV